MNPGGIAGGGILPRMPRAGWEGWFLIGIPRRGSPVRFLKTHFFRSKKRALLTPLGALEGLTAERELLTLVATASKVYEFRKTFAPHEERVDSRKFSIALGEDLRWTGEGDRYEHNREAAGLSLGVRADAKDKATWISASPVLSYFGLHSALSGSVTLGEDRHSLEGLAVQEHAWGALAPFDPTRLVTGRWHWDVLAIEEWDGRKDVPGHTGFAGLSAPLPLLGPRGLRAWGRVPGGEFSRFSKFEVAPSDWREVASGFDGRPGKFPSRWRGNFSGRAGDLSYEARASTPLALAAPGGGFLGFDFEGTWKGAVGAPSRVCGSGFAECGGPA